MTYEKLKLETEFAILGKIAMWLIINQVVTRTFTAVDSGFSLRRFFSWSGRVFPPTHLTSTQHHNLIVPFSMADTVPTIIEDSTFSYMRLRNSTIRNCILRFVEVRSSTIQNSTLYDCRLFNCVVQKSTLTNTQLYETKIKKRCTIKGCTAAMSPLALRKLPPEVREMIFRYCVGFTDGKTPPLIVALRGDKKLYREAMRLFYKLNFFTLNKRTAALCWDMGATAGQNIQQLKIE
jgi:hypothetical protein